MRGLRVVLVVVALVALAIGVFLRWSSIQTRPDEVARHMRDAVSAALPGATVHAASPRWLDVSLPSGLRLDVDAGAAIDACPGRPFDCRSAIAASGDDARRAAVLADKPTADAVRAVVTAGGGASLARAEMSELLIGALELRYAQVAGPAAVYVTQAMAARMGLDLPKLHDLAIRAALADETVRVEPLTDASKVFRVRAAGDPAVLLADTRGMQRIAEAVHAPSLIAAIPDRGALWIAANDAPDRAALRKALADAADRPIEPFVVDAAAGTLRDLKLDER